MSDNERRRREAFEKVKKDPRVAGKTVTTHVTYVDSVGSDPRLRAAFAMHVATPDQARELLRWHVAYSAELDRALADSVGHDDTAEYDKAAALNNEAVVMASGHVLCTILSMRAWPGDVVARGQIRAWREQHPEDGDKRLRAVAASEREFLAALRAEFGTEPS